MKEPDNNIMQSTYIERLRLIHEQIKENPFRKNPEINIRYGKGYCEQFYLLRDALNAAFRSNEFPILNLITSNFGLFDFFHDISKYITNLRYCCAILDGDFASLDGTKWETDKKEAVSDLYKFMEELEFFLINVHLFTDTGVINSFRIWDFGAYLELVYHPELNEYVVERVVTVSERNAWRFFCEDGCKKYKVTKSVKEKALKEAELFEKTHGTERED